MNNDQNVSSEAVEQLYKKLNKDADAAGYHLNPDEEHTKALIGRAIAITGTGHTPCPAAIPF
ncbi:MAG: hypothetical protein R6U21_04370 [Thermoplasmatota archaeon]